MSKRSFAEVSFPISVSKSGNNSFTATAHNGCKSLFLSSVKKKNMKGRSLFNAKYYLCNRNSERSLVIQNNELSRISLISKSLPIQPVFNRRVLCFKHLAQYHIFLPDSNNFISFTDFLQFAQNERRKHPRPSSRAYPTIVCAFCLHAFTR